MELVRHAANRALMRAERRIRVAHRTRGTTRFYPEQLVDDDAVRCIEDALFVLRRLEDAGKVNITLTARRGDEVIYEGGPEGFVSMGDPGPDVMMSVRADLTDEWASEMRLEA